MRKENITKTQSKKSYLEYQIGGAKPPEYPQHFGAKIILFPSVTLQNQPCDFQDELEGFLREMGYIE